MKFQSCISIFNDRFAVLLCLDSWCICKNNETFYSKNLNHSVKKRKILSHRIFFREIISLLTSLVKTFLSRNFCQHSVRVSFRNFNTAHCGVHNCITGFRKISVKITSLVKSFTVKLISRNNSQMIQKFRKLHTVQRAALSPIFFFFFSWNQLFRNFFWKTVVFTNFLWNKCVREFP